MISIHPKKGINTFSELDHKLTEIELKPDAKEISSTKSAKKRREKHQLSKQAES